MYLKIQSGIKQKQSRQYTRTTGKMYLLVLTFTGCVFRSYFGNGLATVLIKDIIICSLHIVYGERERVNDVYRDTRADVELKC